MPLYALQSSVLAAAGQVAIAAGATVEVRRESDDGLAVLWLDLAGTSSAGNPAAAGSDGFFRVYLEAGDYRVVVTAGLSSTILRHYRVGPYAEDAPAVTPEVLRRRWVDVADYVPSNDALDCHAGVQAALINGLGREIVFTAGAVGSAGRVYRFDDRTDGRLYLPQRARVIFEPGAELDFTGWGTAGTSSPYLYAQGPVGTPHLLAGDGVQGARTVTVAAGEGAAFARSDAVFVRSNAMFTAFDDTLGTRGEQNTVVSVAGDVVTLAVPLRDNYLTGAGASLTTFDPLRITVEYPRIVGAGRFASAAGDRGIQLINGRSCSILGADILWADLNGINLCNILDGLVDRASVTFDAKGASAALQYGVVLVNMCEAVRITNSDVWGGSESYALSASGGAQGVTRNCSVSECRANGSSRSAFCTHDTHEDWRVSNSDAVDVEQGIDHRIKGGIFTGIAFRRMGAHSNTLSMALQLGAGAGDVLFSDNWISGAVRIARLGETIDHGSEGVGDFHFLDNVARAITGVAIDIHDLAGSTFQRGLVRGAGNAIDGGLFPFQVEGSFRAVWMDNVLRSSGGMGRVAWLHATDNGGAGFGPVNGVVVGNIHDSSFLPALIQDTTSPALVQDNRQMGTRSGNDLYGTKTHDFASIAAGAAGTSTTVTVTGAAVGDEAFAEVATATAIGLHLEAVVTAVDTVTVQPFNYSGSAVDLPSTTLRVRVIKA